MNESVIIQKLIQVGQMLERGELEYSGAEIDTKHYLEQYIALPQPAVSGSLPLDRTSYRQCNECLKWRMIGTQCKNPQTMMCDNDERYFYKGNDR
jgi:hypothetical protein